MFICICQEVTDREIKQTANEGVNSIKDLRKSLKVGVPCGQCLESAKGLLKEHQAVTSPLKIQAD